MLRLESEVAVEGLTGRQVTDFLLDPRDDRYRAWWPGTHLAYHRLRAGRPDHVGDVVRMDEYIGARRLRMDAEVVAVEPGERVVWRMVWRRVPLPVLLTLRLQPHGDGVLVRHTITAGWAGPGCVLDPVWRVYFNRSFATAMDRHVRTEFPRLRRVTGDPQRSDR